MSETEHCPRCGWPGCTFPLCPGCEEECASIDRVGLCRDCDIDKTVTEMTCATCGKLRLNEHGKAFFGDPGCECAEPTRKVWVPWAKRTATESER